MKNKSKETKISLAERRKLVKKLIARDIKTREEQLIEDFASKSYSTKKLAKELKTGKQWITKLKHKEKLEYNREDITEIATKLYEDLYANKTPPNTENLQEDNHSVLPVLQEEISIAIKKSKLDKSPGEY